MVSSRVGAAETCIFHGAVLCHYMSLSILNKARQGLSSLSFNVTKIVLLKTIFNCMANSHVFMREFTFLLKNPLTFWGLGT